MSELRYHPFLGEWVITATARQDRTFHPPPEFCPLCPTRDGGHETEITEPGYDLAVFENRFPSLQNPAPKPSIAGSPLMPVAPSAGVCEVVCYSQDHDATLATLPLTQVEKLVRVWKHRYEALAARPEVQYVFVFENKGKEIGVTLSHPHCQIYAYPYIPPVLERELRNERQHFEKTGRTLFEDWLAHEVSHSAGARLVYENAGFAAIVPFFARWPYEVWVVPWDPVTSLAAMSPDRLDDLASALHAVSRKYDAVFGFSMPYVMCLHQEPAVNGYSFTRFHVEFYPPYRTESKLKYLAGSEAGAGAFINDTLPEETAARLRQVQADRD